MIPRMFARCIIVPMTMATLFLTLTAAAAPPNILIFYTDDQGYGDVGVFGAKGYKTPNLDNLARQGCVFRNFYVAQPVCSASRAALLTGSYPNRVGIHGALGPRAKTALNHEEMTLAEVLKAKGYSTAIVGKWHLGDSKDYLPVRHGFDQYYGLPYSNDMWPYHPEHLGRVPPAYPDLPLIRNDHAINPKMTPEDQDRLIVDYTKEAVNFISANTNKPFLLYLAHNLPHVPLHVSAQHRGKSGAGLYGDVIEEIDWSMGQVLAALDRFGLRENTWVIFASDNGPWLSYGEHSGSSGGLREGKGTVWEGGVRVPCIMRWPGQIPAGAESRAMLMTIDLLPTIANRAGAPHPTLPIDGKDVWPLISRRPGATNPHSSYWFYYHVNELHAVTRGDGRYKLVLPHTYRTLAGRPGGTNGFPAKYEMRQIIKPELYDLQEDRDETRDIAADKPDVMDQLMAEAEKAREELGDSLTKRTGRGNRLPGRPARD